MSEVLTLVKGGNIKVEDAFGDPAAHIAVTIGTRSGDDTVIPTDVSVLVLGSDGKVRSNDDLVFYNQPSGADGAVRLKIDSAPGGEPDRAATIEVDLAALPESVDRILIAASIDADGDDALTFGAAEALQMSARTVGSTSTAAVVCELTGLADELAVIFGEIYRRGSEWKIRAVGQGYRFGLHALVTEYGIDVDDPKDDPSNDDESSAEPTAPDVVASAQDEPNASGSRDSRIALGRKRKQVAKLPDDWKDRVSPGLPVDPSAGPWRPARLFPTVGIRSSAEQEGRTTSVLLSVMATVPEFGRRIASLVGAPRGRIETFTEVAFSVGGQDLRPDGLIRITRGASEWTALVEVKTAKGALNADQIESYIRVARAKGFDAVITITCDIALSPGELPIPLATRPPKSVAVSHVSWEEVATEAALLLANGSIDRTHARVIEQLLLYSSEQQSGMWQFGDMGRHWVKVRNGVTDGTLSASDPATSDVCSRFDQLSRHLALQLTALTGQIVTPQIPGSPADSVSRSKQLADSGELFGTLRVAGATAPIVVNANLARLRIGCSQMTPAPRTGRVGTKVNWLLRQLETAPPKLKVTAHHLGSRTDVTSALLETAREDPSVLHPSGDRDIREFTVTAESSMGSKRAAAEAGFVATTVSLVNEFHRNVTEVLRVPKTDR